MSIDDASLDAPVDAGPPNPDIALWHGRADAALQALLVRTWLAGTPYLSAQIPATSTLAGYWTFAQAFDVVDDGVERTHGVHYAGWIQALYLAQNGQGWSRDYYDDENWMALALLRAYDLENHDSDYLNRASSLFADIEAAWDTSCCGSQHGGIWWDRSHTQKATAANAGPVITGVRLAARTGDNSYLTFAEQVYAYWLANMVDSTTHAVTDHITSSGQLVSYTFTYNEGLMMGAAVELYNATHVAQYLADANAIAGYMIATEVETTPDGTALSDGTNSGCTGDCAQFKGIGYRYLQELQDADPHPAYAAVLAASAHAAYDFARGGDLYATDWAGPTMASMTIDAQSSAAMAIARYAQSLGTYDISASSTYEAEDGVVHGIGLETINAGYTGWSYLAGWQGNGKSVDIPVNVATQGAYQLEMHYAAGAGDASREIDVNGSTVVANAAFLSTGAWSTWSTSTVDVTLPAGASTITVSYNSNNGSTNYLNLDSITVAQ